MNKDQLDEYKKFARERLGVEFRDIQLLITALTHRSYMNEHRGTVKEHNERLEFLGDAVLELVTSDFLYRNYDQAEGVMTNWRAALVRTESISDAGTRLGFADLVRLSRGERRTGLERAHMVIMADCFEAVIGAIYLDQGYKAAAKVIYDNILARTDEIVKSEAWRDAKSRLQELAQRQEGVTPIYKVLKEEGPDHDKLFTVGVFVGNVQQGMGTGSSKQIAQVEAAARALEKYK